MALILSESESKALGQKGQMTNMTVINIIDGYKRINNSPLYQRGDVWPISKRKGYIWNLTNNIARTMATVNKREDNTFDVIDSKQRLTSIYWFSIDKFKISIGGRNYSYSELNKALQEEPTSDAAKFLSDFRNTNISTCEYRGLTIKEQCYLFEQLNQAVDLTKTEKMFCVNYHLNHVIAEFYTQLFLLKDSGFWDKCLKKDIYNNAKSKGVRFMYTLLCLNYGGLKNPYNRFKGIPLHDQGIQAQSRHDEYYLEAIVADNCINFSLENCHSVIDSSSLSGIQKEMKKVLSYWIKIVEQMRLKNARYATHYKDHFVVYTISYLLQKMREGVFTPTYIESNLTLIADGFVKYFDFLEDRLDAYSLSIGTQVYSTINRQNEHMTKIDQLFLTVDGIDWGVKNNEIPRQALAQAKAYADETRKYTDPVSGATLTKNNIQGAHDAAKALNSKSTDFHLATQATNLIEGMGGVPRVPIEMLMSESS